MNIVILENDRNASDLLKAAVKELGSNPDFSDVTFFPPDLEPTSDGNFDECLNLIDSLEGPTIVWLDLELGLQNGQKDELEKRHKIGEGLSQIDGVGFGFEAIQNPLLTPLILCVASRWGDTTLARRKLTRRSDEICGEREIIVRESPEMVFLSDPELPVEKFTQILAFLLQQLKEKMGAENPFLEP